MGQVRLSGKIGYVLFVGMDLDGFFLVPAVDAGFRSAFYAL
jgi:hypothetical protein